MAMYLNQWTIVIFKICTYMRLFAYRKQCRWTYNASIKWYVDFYGSIPRSSYTHNNRTNKSCICTTVHINCASCLASTCVVGGGNFKQQRNCVTAFVDIGSAFDSLIRTVERREVENTIYDLAENMLHGRQLEAELARDKMQVSVIRECPKQGGQRLHRSMRPLLCREFSD